MCGFSSPQYPVIEPLLLEDPTILSGTLRSTLDIFDEYEDAEIVRDALSLVNCRNSRYSLVRSPSTCPPHPIGR